MKLQKKMAASKFRTPMERKKAIDSREWKFVKLKNKKKPREFDKAKNDDVDWDK